MFASSPKSKREQRDPRLTAHMDGESQQPTSMTPGQHLVSPDMLDQPLLRSSIICFPVLKLRFPIATRLAVTFAFFYEHSVLVYTPSVCSSIRGVQEHRLLPLFRFFP